LYVSVCILAINAGYQIIESQTMGYPEIQSRLKPNYAVGCSMVSKSSVYYKTMTEPNVTLHTDPITEISENAILTETGTRIKPDVSQYLNTKVFNHGINFR